MRYVNCNQILLLQLFSATCPEIDNENFRLTTRGKGFGLHLELYLECKYPKYKPYPRKLKCRQRSEEDRTLVWSHIPMCHFMVDLFKTEWLKPGIRCTDFNSELKINPDPNNRTIAKYQDYGKQIGICMFMLDV